MPNKLDLNINGNGEAKPSEQFLAQVKFNIATGRIKPGTVLPSYDEATIKYGLTRKDYEEILADLEKNGWIVKAKQKYVVRPHPVGFLPHNSLNTLDSLIIRLLSDAHDENCSFEEVRRRFNKWYKAFDRWLITHDLNHFLVVEDVDETMENEYKTALREILVLEIKLKTKVNARFVSTEDLKQYGLPDNAFPVAVYGRAYDLENLLPKDMPFLPLRISSIDGVLKALQQSGAKRVAIISNRSGYYHEWASKLLSNIDPGDLLRCDPEDHDWRKRLDDLCQNPAERPLVVADLASQLVFDEHPTEKGKFRVIKHPFDLYRFNVISDSSLNDLRHIAKFLR